MQCLSSDGTQTINFWGDELIVVQCYSLLAEEEKEGFINFLNAQSNTSESLVTEVKGKK